VLALVDDDVVVIGELPEALMEAGRPQRSDQGRDLLALDAGREDPVEAGGAPDRPTPQRTGRRAALTTAVGRSRAGAAAGRQPPCRPGRVR
jgi:hypothetical protein